MNFSLSQIILCFLIIVFSATPAWGSDKTVQECLDYKLSFRTCLDVTGYCVNTSQDCAQTCMHWSECPQGYLCCIEGFCQANMNCDTSKLNAEIKDKEMEISSGPDVGTTIAIVVPGVLSVLFIFVVVFLVVRSQHKKRQQKLVVANQNMLNMNQIMQMQQQTAIGNQQSSMLVQNQVYPSIEQSNIYQQNMLINHLDQPKTPQVKQQQGGNIQYI